MDAHQFWFIAKYKLSNVEYSTNKHFYVEIHGNVVWNEIRIINVIYKLKEWICYNAKTLTKKFKIFSLFIYTYIMNYSRYIFCLHPNRYDQPFSLSSRKQLIQS